MPESGNLDVETDFSGSGMDTVLGIYSYNPSDGYLVIACDDDGGSELYSRIKLYSQEEFLYVRVWTVGDNSRGTFKIAATDIDTTPPVARATDKEVTLDSSGSASITPEEVGNESTDNSGVEPSYTLSKTTFDCSNLGTSVEVILTATDASGNSSSATAFITVVDNISPSITLNGAAGVTHDAYTTYTDTGATAADNCSATVETVTTGAVDTDIPADYTITYTATDASGNISSSTRIVTVVDNTPPVARATDKEVILDSSGNASITPEEVGNGSADDSGVEPSYTLSKTTFDCSNVGTLVEVILTATDASGNTSSATAIATVVDNISPSITLNGAAAVTHDAYTDYTDSGATTADNCSATLVTIGSVDSNIPADYSITYTARDASGNISSSTRIVTVVDKTPPVARATDKEVTLDSSGNASITPEEVGNGSTDDSGVEPTYTLSKTTFDCSNIGANAVTLTAIDVNGNTSSATAVVTVIDANAATVTFTAPTDLCIGAGKQRSLSGGLPSGGVYSGTGVTDDRNGSTYSFNPATAGDGTHSIRYTFTNASGCAASASDDVAVLEPAGPVVDVITVIVDGGCGSYAGFYNATSMLNDKKSYVSTTDAGNVISYNGSKWVLQQAGGSRFVLFENSTVSADVTPPLTGWIATRYCSRSSMEVGLGVNFTSTARAEDLARVTTGTNLRFYDVAIGGTPLRSAERLTKTVYYVSDTDTATGCESKRTEFTVNIEDGGGRTRTRTRNTKFASSADKTALDTEGFESKVLFSMYSNPSAENVTLSSSMDGDFTIFNLVGQVVKTFTVKANLETVVYVGDLSAGTYVVKPTNSSSISSQKLIIRK